MAQELKAIFLNLDEGKEVTELKDIELKEKQERRVVSGNVAGRRGSVLEGDMKKHGVENDWLVTSPPQGSYTVSTERGAVLDTQVLLLEHNDMFSHMP